MDISTIFKYCEKRSRKIKNHIMNSFPQGSISLSLSLFLFFVFVFVFYLLVMSDNYEMTCQELDTITSTYLSKLEEYMQMCNETANHFQQVNLAPWCRMSWQWWKGVFRLGSCKVYNGNKNYFALFIWQSYESKSKSVSNRA